MFSKNYLMLGPIAAALIFASAPLPANATTVDSGFDKSAVRPATICVASAVCVHKARWRSWGTKKAVATGELRINNRTDRGQFTISRTTLTLSIPKRGRFTRATWKYRTGGTGVSLYSAIVPGVSSWTLQR